MQRSLLRRLIKFGVFYNCAADAVQRFSLVQAQARYRQNPAIASGPSNEIYLCFQQVSGGRGPR